MAQLDRFTLTGSEMIWGKIVGALWAFRWIGYFLGVCWTFGLIVGSIYLLGFLASTIELAVFGWFIAALGVAISVWSKTSIRALTLTIGILLFTNLGCLFLLSLIQTRSMTTLMGCMPFRLTAALVGVADLKQNWSGPSGEVLMASIVGTTSYALAAGWLIFHAIASYDSVVDRPDQRRSLGPERL